MNTPLPSLHTALTPEAIRQRVAEASKRGKVPGFAPAQEDCLFRLEAYGTPFDSELIARARPHAANGSVVEFELRLARRMPILFWVVSALAAWPGVWLTDSMLKSYFSGYHFKTWMWYLPLTIVPLPWAWRVAVRRSRATAHASGQELVEKLRAILDAAPAPAPAQAAAS